MAFQAFTSFQETFTRNMRRVWAYLTFGKTLCIAFALGFIYFIGGWEELGTRLAMDIEEFWAWNTYLGSGMHDAYFKSCLSQPCGWRGFLFYLFSLTSLLAFYLLYIFQSERFHNLIHWIKFKYWVANDLYCLTGDYREAIRVFYSLDDDEHEDLSKKRKEKKGKLKASEVQKAEKLPAVPGSEGDNAPKAQKAPKSMGRASRSVRKRPRKLR